jgi:hypothetical protein
VTVLPADDAPRHDLGADGSDALTVAFGDPAADLYGVARLGLAAGGASGLVLLFHEGRPVAVAAEGGVALAGAPASWDEVSAAGLDVEDVEPLRRWRLHFAGEDASFDLELEAAGAVAELDPAGTVARAGGMAGYEQPVRVRGTASAGDRRVRLDGLGQRGRSWGAPDWERIALARTVSAWMDEVAVSLTAVRPARASDHAGEAVAATIVETHEGASVALDVPDARLTTTYDAEGRQRTAGLELWLDEDGWPRRAAGEVVCGTSLDLGRLRLDAAFLRWRMEGREGIGRYDVLRRVEP